MGSEAVTVMNEENKLMGGTTTPEEIAEHEYDLELETPKGSLFDSFAPASDKLLVQHSKYRRALFKDFSAKQSDEEHLFDIIYSTIMDAILQEAAAKSAPTCPPPPIKSATKHRWIHKEICRKLQF